jgi:hypothetical protein
VSAGPAGYRLVVPQGWWAVELDPERTAASVAALVEHQWRGVDDAPHLKAQARAELNRQAAAAREAGGLELYLSVDALEGVPLSASLLVSSAALAGPGELTELADRRRRNGADVVPVQLPAGPALRSRWAEASTLDGVEDAELPVTTCLDVHVPVPGLPRVLLLSFRTPLEPLAQPMVELFDAITTTLQWSDGSPVRPRRRNGTSR